MYSENSLIRDVPYASTGRSLTTTERIDSQIQFHEKRLAELKELKELFDKQPDISRAMDLITSGII